MEPGQEFARLVEIMRRLRVQCPWDRSQTHAGLRPYLLEEAYEVLHALDRQDFEDLREELGDLMLQIVFHAELAEEAGRFTIADVLRTVNEKLVRRHPHVFGDSQAETPADVVRRWETIKRSQEQKPSALDGVPAALPALVRAARVLVKVKQAGLDPFAGRDAEAEAGAWLEGLARASERHRGSEAGTSAGMLALTATELAEHAGASLEDALREALARLTAVFQEEERRVAAEGRTFADLSEDELRQVEARLLPAPEGGSG